MMSDILYNVNQIDIPNWQQINYKRFSYKLNRFLQFLFPRYYRTLQLYQSVNNANRYYVITAYNNLPGIYNITPVIQEVIERIYNYVWGNSVIRASIFSYVSAERVIPPLKY